MMSTETQAQPTSAYDERIFNDRMRQLFDSIDSPSLLSPEKPTGPMASIVDALFPEQASHHHHHQQPHQQQHLRDQRRSSTNDLTAASDRFPLWTASNGKSASAFCGGATNPASAFANRRQSTLHGSTRSLRNTHHLHQPQPSNYRAPPVTRPRFTASSIRLPSAAIISASNLHQANTLPRSSSSLSTNSATGGSSSTDYQPRFASRLSSTRLPTAAGPVGSHDQIGAAIDPIASLPSLSMLSGQPSSSSSLIARNTSSSNVPSQQFVTMTQTTTTTFCYLPASASLAYQNSTGAGRSAAIPHH